MLTGHGHVYFEASAVLITIVVFGRFLEAKAKGKTSDAIKKLIGLKPKIAIDDLKGEKKKKRRWRKTALVAGAVAIIESTILILK